MPRTKRPVGKKEKPASAGDEMKKLDRLAADQKNEIEKGCQKRIRDIELAFKILAGSYNPNVLNKTIFELKNELVFREPPRITLNTTRSALSQDDGYLTANSSQGSGEHRKEMAPPSTVGLSTGPGRRSRSADARPCTATKQSARRSRSVFKTPACNRRAGNVFPVITPKVAPDTTVAVMRHPRQGELVVSMSGSPVMVPTFNNMQPNEKANCNIMLDDGTMLSLAAKKLRPSSAYIPFALMDAAVMSQLKTLKDNLDKMVKMGEQAKDQK